MLDSLSIPPPPPSGRNPKKSLSTSASRWPSLLRVSPTLINIGSMPVPEKCVALRAPYSSLIKRAAPPPGPSQQAGRCAGSSARWRSPQLHRCSPRKKRPSASTSPSQKPYKLRELKSRLSLPHTPSARRLDTTSEHLGQVTQSRSAADPRRQRCRRLQTPSGCSRCRPGGDRPPPSPPAP